MTDPTPRPALITAVAPRAKPGTLPVLSVKPGSPGRLAVLQLLARHPGGLYEQELRIGVQVQLQVYVSAQQLATMLQGLMQPQGTASHPRPALVAREGRHGRWYSPQAREAADARAGRPLAMPPAKPSPAPASRATPAAAPRGARNP